MKHALEVLLLCSLSAAPVLAADSLPAVEIVTASSQPWHFWHVTVKHTDAGYVVSGMMNSAYRFGLPDGHIDLAAYASEGDGKRLAETTTRYYPSHLTRLIQRRGGLRFSATLPGTLPEDAVIKVSFHRETVKPLPPPVHDETVAL